MKRFYIVLHALDQLCLVFAYCAAYVWPNKQSIEPWEDTEHLVCITSCAQLVSQACGDTSFHAIKALLISMHTKHALPHKLNTITNGIKLPLLHALQSSIYDSHKPDVWCIFRTFTPNVFLATGLLLRFQAVDLIHKSKTLTCLVLWQFLRLRPKSRFFLKIEKSRNRDFMPQSYDFNKSNIKLIKVKTLMWHGHQQIIKAFSHLFHDWMSK